MKRTFDSMIAELAARPETAEFVAEFSQVAANDGKGIGGLRSKVGRKAAYCGWCYALRILLSWWDRNVEYSNALERANLELEWCIRRYK